MPTDPEPQLPLRPSVGVRTLGTTEALAGFIDTHRDCASLGVVVHAPGRYAGQTGEPVALALAPTDATAVGLVSLQSDRPDLAPLRSWWSSDGAPFLALSDGQRAYDLLDAIGMPIAASRWNTGHVGDVTIAATLLFAGTERRPRDLEVAVARALRQRLPDSAMMGIGLGDPGLQTRLAAEAAVLVPLMQALTPMLRKRELVRVYGLELDLVPAVVAMERAGVRVDAAAFQRIADGWARERTDTTDPARITRLDKLISTYGHWARDFVGLDGRIRAHLHPLAADSGRFSCTDPNLQQVPSSHTAPGLRACFVPEPGHVFVIADYAQIELRVAAHLAPCETLRQVFRDGRDPHRTTAATIMDRDEASITAHERKLAKAVNFGFLFGMGAPKFREYAKSSYGVELDETGARRAREAFLSTYPGIAAWHRRVGNLGRQVSERSVTVRTVLGRRKRFEPGHFSYSAALNIPVQGTAAEGFKRAMIRLHERLPSVGGRGVLCVHDEYIAEVPEDRADEGAALVEQTMREAMAEIVTSVPIMVDVEVAASWGGGA